MALDNLSGEHVFSGDKDTDREACENLSLLNFRDGDRLLRCLDVLSDASSWACTACVRGVLGFLEDVVFTSFVGVVFTLPSRPTGGRSWSSSLALVASEGRSDFPGWPALRDAWDASSSGDAFEDCSFSVALSSSDEDVADALGVSTALLGSCDDVVGDDNAAVSPVSAETSLSLVVHGDAASTPLASSVLAS